ncbi:MAG: hypothetical protein V3S11_07140 [Elusimicrobiota bacterium]
MALFDLFGIAKTGGSGPEKKRRVPPPVEIGAPRSPKPRRRMWAALIAVDSALILACVGMLGARVFTHWTASQAAPQRAVKAAPPAPVKKAPPSAPAKKAAAPAKKAPEPPKAAAVPKGPLGSPAVHAPDLPKRSAAPAAPGTPSKAKPEPKPESAAAPKKVRSTKPISFDYVNPDAKEVHLIGMFLVRTGGKKPMFKDSQGAWQTTVYLRIGQTYRYRFEVTAAQGGKKLTSVKTIDVF